MPVPIGQQHIRAIVHWDTHRHRMLSAFVTLTFLHWNGQVYVIGEVGICEELDNVNIKWTGGPEDKGKEIELKSGFFLEHDKDVSVPL